MTIALGTRLGAYQIVAPLGAGGMGEVYRARDPKLGRDVAIKVLPSALVNDPERLARFDREARLLAALTHPHIAAIYSVEESGGLRALVLELVEGTTLEERLKAEAPVGLPMADVLAFASQIADALDAAHERGIVHRDLKPANIMITPEGAVKILDFGLAKAATAESSMTVSPTSIVPTAAGTLLGTAPYMSPEQARGKPVDKRADIWAFGCVLYEMLSGRRAFAGDTSTDAIVAIIERDPDWHSLPQNTPAPIVRVLRRCLVKDRRHRQRDIGDVRLDIAEALSGAGAAAPAAASRRQFASTAGIALTTFVLGAAGVWTMRSSVPPSQTADAPVKRLTVRIQSGIGAIDAEIMGSLRGGRSVAVSPDGTRIAFVANIGGSSRLYLRALNQSAGTSIDGTEGASAPFFSPDGRWVAFFAGGQLRKIQIEGGHPVNVCDAPDNTGGASGAWGRDGTIVFALPATARAGLMRVSADGGKSEVLTTPDPSEGGGHFDPSFTLDGRGVLFATRSTRNNTESIMVRSLMNGEQRKIVDGGERPLQMATGHLIFGRGSAIVAMKFDAVSWQPSGKAVLVQDGVVRGQIDVSADGLLAYVGEPAVDGRSVVWVDRSGVETTAVSGRRGFGRPRLSPDGQRLLVEVAQDTGDPALRTLRSQSSGSDVWLYNFQNGAFTRVTTNGRSNSPFWTPDGKRIAYRTNQSIFWQPVDGGTAEPLIAPSEPGLDAAGVAPGAWSPDGKTLLFVVHGSGATGADIWSLTPDPPRTARPVVARPGDQWSARVSPDQRWISYASNESGRWDVFIEPFGGGARHAASTDGGEQAIWSPKGDELFYRNGDQMLAVSVSGNGAGIETGPPHLLFRGQYVSTDLAAYDVSRDGRRFLMIRPSDDELRPAEISVVENWFAELKRLVP